MPIEKAPCISVIVPTFNEEKHLEFLLSSLEDQTLMSFEALIVDGGSKDKTYDISRQHNAKIVVLPGFDEFASRNVGAKMAKGDFLLFTCADIIFPNGLLQKIEEKFEQKPELVALSGPGYPFDASFFGKIEYIVYNIIRYLFAKLPKPLKRFSTSTNFLVVRKDTFDRVGGFEVNEINADGLMGKKLLQMGEVAFFLDTPVCISARRMKNMGFLSFNKHYMYVFENLFFFLSKTSIMKNLKLHSKMKHRKLHEP
ncbi:MAG: glycosyltransferase [Candidatus Bathyarchaeota archaeon]|nr:glycosyltransferase [Candidatus Bathyarchaeota archaeon]